MTKVFFTLLSLLLLTACSSAPSQEEEKKETMAETKEEAIKKAENNVKALKEKTNSLQVQTIAQEENVSGSVLYARKCASCHGINGKKSALNASAPIAGWDSKKTQKILKAYINGSYGGKMKAIMKAQSKPLSDKEIKLISDYLSTL